MLNSDHAHASKLETQSVAPSAQLGHAYGAHVCPPAKHLLACCASSAVPALPLAISYSCDSNYAEWIADTLQSLGKSSLPSPKPYGTM